jgi:hypothetical protein
VAAEPPAQADGVTFERAARRALGAPATAQQLGLREDTAGRRGQAAKQRELAPRQAQVDAVEERQSRRRANLDWPNRQAPLAAALQRAQSCAQLGGAERSGKHDVSAVLECGHDSGAADADDEECSRRVICAQRGDA